MNAAAVGLAGLIIGSELVIAALFQRKTAALDQNLVVRTGAVVLYILAHAVIKEVSGHTGHGDPGAAFHGNHIVLPRIAHTVNLNIRFHGSGVCLVAVDRDGQFRFALAAQQRQLQVVPTHEIAVHFQIHHAVIEGQSVHGTGGVAILGFHQDLRTFHGVSVPVCHAQNHIIDGPVFYLELLNLFIIPRIIHLDASGSRQHRQGTAAICRHAGTCVVFTGHGDSHGPLPLLSVGAGDDQLRGEAAFIVVIGRFAVRPFQTQGIPGEGLLPLHHGNGYGLLFHVLGEVDADTVAVSHGSGHFGRLSGFQGDVNLQLDGQHGVPAVCGDVISALPHLLLAVNGGGVNGLVVLLLRHHFPVALGHIPAVVALLVGFQGIALAVILCVPLDGGFAVLIVGGDGGALHAVGKDALIDVAGGVINRFQRIIVVIVVVILFILVFSAVLVLFLLQPANLRLDHFHLHFQIGVHSQTRQIGDQNAQRRNAAAADEADQGNRRGGDLRRQRSNLSVEQFDIVQSGQVQLADHIVTDGAVFIRMVVDLVQQMAGALPVVIGTVGLAQ